MKILVAALLLATSALAAPHKVLDVRTIGAGDPQRVAFVHAVRAITLDDGSAVTLYREEGAETSAVAGQLVTRDGKVSTLRASEWIPEGLVASGTSGQIFSAALLDSGNLAVSIGWTNATGRNINGIAIVERRGARWQRKHLIALPGTIRDVAAAPDDGIVVAVTDASGKLPAVEILLLGSDGTMRGSLFRQTTREIGEAIDRASEIRLQRVSRDVVTRLDLGHGVRADHRIVKSGTCDGKVTRRNEGVVLYPEKAAPCYTTTLSRLGAFRALPKEAESMKTLDTLAVHLTNDDRIVVVRQGFDGREAFTFITGDQTATLPTTMQRGSWRAVRITDDTVEAAETTADGLVAVSVAIPK